MKHGCFTISIHLKLVIWSSEFQEIMEKKHNNCIYLEEI